MDTLFVHFVTYLWNKKCDKNKSWQPVLRTEFYWARPDCNSVVLRYRWANLPISAGFLTHIKMRYLWSNLLPKNITTFFFVLDFIHLCLMFLSLKNHVSKDGSSSSSGKERETLTLLDPVGRAIRGPQIGNSSIHQIQQSRCIPFLPEYEGISILRNVETFKT
jgi:hypothetical protein